jgi:large subunit ribosomal protein L23
MQAHDVTAALWQSHKKLMTEARWAKPAAALKEIRQDVQKTLNPPEGMMKKGYRDYLREVRAQAKADSAKRSLGPKLEPHQIILAPLVTEKGTHQSTNEHHNAYSFQVNLWANKTEIKQAVQELFSVRVLAVRTQLRMGKQRRVRFKSGRLSHWKKAIVKLHPDDKIEFF